MEIYSPKEKQRLFQEIKTNPSLALLRAIEEMRKENLNLINQRLLDIEKLFLANLENIVNTKIPNLDAVLYSVKGKDGKDGVSIEGKQGLPGQNADEEKIIREVLSKIPLPANGKDGKDGKNADEEKIIRRIVASLPPQENVDYELVIKEVLKRIPRPEDGKDGSPDTGDIIIEKINVATEKIDASRIKNLPKSRRGTKQGGGDIVVAGDNITIVRNSDGTKTIASEAVSDSATTILQKARYAFLSLGSCFWIHWNVASAQNVESGETNGNITLDSDGKPAAASIFYQAVVDVDQWLDTIVEAGAKAAILTDVHAGGFYLHTTVVTTYNTSTLAYRVYSAPAAGMGDVLARFCKGCRARGLKIGVYFGIDTDAVTSLAKYKAAMTEVLANPETNAYGYIDFVWSDSFNEVGYGANPWNDNPAGQEVYDLVKSLQPNCLWINNTRYGGTYPNPTDLSDFEQLLTFGNYSYEYSDFVDAGLHPRTGLPFGILNETSQVTTDGRQWFYYASAALKTWLDIHADRELAKAFGNTMYMMNTTPNSKGIYTSDHNLFYKLLGRKTIELAQGKTATASSSRYSGTIPFVLVDGKSWYNQTNIPWVSNDGDMIPYAEIDLGTMQDIHGIVMWGPTGGGRSYFRDMTVTIYDDSHNLLVTSSVIKPVTLASDSCDQTVKEIYTPPDGTRGRYIRVTRNAANAAGPWGKIGGGTDTTPYLFLNGITAYQIQD